MIKLLNIFLLFNYFNCFSCTSYLNKKCIISNIKMNNALLDHSELPRFSDIKVNEIQNDIEKLIKKTNNDFEEYENTLADNINYNSIIERNEEILFPLEYSWGIVSHLNGVKNSDELREAYQKCQPQIITLYNKMEQSKKLYDALNLLIEANELDDTQHRIVNSMIKSMKLGGVGFVSFSFEKSTELHEK